MREIHSSTFRLRPIGLLFGVLGLVGLFAGSLALASPGGAPSPRAEPVAARATGTYVEICACARVCETALDSAGKGKCDFVAAMKVDAGQRGEVPLSGLAVALVATSAEGRGEDSKRAAGVVYVDRRANQAQAEALSSMIVEKLATRVSGPIGPPKAAELRVERGTEVIEVEIEGVADLRGRPIFGPYRRLVELQHGPGMTFLTLCLGRGIGGQIVDAPTGVRFDGDGKSILFGSFNLATEAASRRRAEGRQ